MKVTTNFWILPNGAETELDLTVHGEYYPGSPGKLSGPPEDCYPAEDEAAEIIEVRNLDGTIFTGDLTEEDKRRAEDAIISHVRDMD